MNTCYPIFTRAVFLLGMCFFVTGSQAGSFRMEQTGTLVSDIRSWAEKLSPFTHKSTDEFQWLETTHVDYDLREQPSTYTGRMREADSLNHVVSPGGMFPRMGSGFHHGLGKLSDRSVNVIQNDNNLVLSAALPNSLLSNPGDVVWRIKPQDMQTAYQLYGQNQALSLPVGVYDVSLNIGHYQEQRLIEVKPERIAKAVFSANVGRLQVYSEKLANWAVVSLQQGTMPEHIRSSGLSHQFDAILGAGEYDVTAMLGEMRQHIRVRVDKGKTEVAYIQIPGGRVNLVATLGNAPALRPMEWKIFRLDEGRREIAAPSRHSATLLMPAGHYEAVAILNGKQRSRQFTVSNGADSSVVLAMD